MSPIAAYKELQAQILRETTPDSITSQNFKRPRLAAQWLKEDGKLICKWHVSE